MTLKQFIRQIPNDILWERHGLGKWAIPNLYAIRAKNLQMCCPLTAPFNLGACYGLYCAKKLGIPDHIGEYIEWAADYTIVPLRFQARTDPSNLMELRKILLKACGLEEQS